MDNPVASEACAYSELKFYPGLSEVDAREYQVSAAAWVQGSVLYLRYKIEAGNEKKFAEILLADPLQGPMRKDELWKETCFECFIPALNSTAYLELNLSPSGNWNAYAFQDYRKGMNAFALDHQWAPVQRVIAHTDNTLETEWLIPLEVIQKGFASVPTTFSDFGEVGLTVVLKTSELTLYWSLEHSSLKPDFHDRVGFKKLIRKVQKA